MWSGRATTSAISVNGLVWTGAKVTAVAPQTLRLDQASITVGGAAAGSAAGNCIADDLSPGLAVLGPSITGSLAFVPEQGADTGAPARRAMPPKQRP